MNKYSAKLKSLESVISIENNFVDYSASHGVAFLNSEMLDVFIYSSTFYLDLTISATALAGSKVAALVYFDTEDDSFDAICGELLDENGDFVEQLCFARQSTVAHAFLDKIRVAIPLPSSVSDGSSNSMKIRLWIYSNVIEPILVKITRISLIYYSDCIDITRQIGDFIPSSLRQGWSDTLRPLIDSNWSALHFAAHWNHDVLVEHLIARGWNPDTPESNGGTALHRAADIRSSRIAEILLSSGASVNAVDYNLKETPLDCAYRKGGLDVVNILIENGGKRFCELNSAEIG